MGGGAFATAGFAHAAYQRVIFYIDTAYNSQWAGLTTATPSPRCYTILFTPASASFSAIPRPIPRELPVTKAVLCDSAIAMTYLLLLADFRL